MTNIKEITQEIIRFRDQRKWKKFHTPKNLALSMIIEAGELFEIFQWLSDDEIYSKLEEEKDHLSDELADVAIYLFSLANILEVNLEEAIRIKLKKNAKKYPV
ncbi:hypothetical protein ES705_13658 [subsurface metagenome]|jgi:NTP pyrophosphatase (non-canonical NTP hydrolase)